MTEVEKNWALRERIAFFPPKLMLSYTAGTSPVHLQDFFVLPTNCGDYATANFTAPFLLILWLAAGLR